MIGSSLAFIFPGQGSQSLGMLADLATAYPGIGETFAEASEGAECDLWTLCQIGPEERLNQTRYTQPLLLAASIALWRCWRSCQGALPTLLAGHSLGEYSALVAADSLTLVDAARLVSLRGRLMQEAVPVGMGAMAAVLGADDALVEDVCRRVSDCHSVYPANYNAPGQIVIGGHADAVDKALAALAEHGVRKVVKLPVSVPSHTPLMRDAADQLRQALSDVAWSLPTLPVVQNGDAQTHASVADIRDALVRQLFHPVRWRQCVQVLISEGIHLFAECGPGDVLAGLNKRIDKTIMTRSLSSLSAFQAALEVWSQDAQSMPLR